MNVFKKLNIFFFGDKEQDLRDKMIMDKIRKLEERRIFLLKMIRFNNDMRDALQITDKEIKSLQGELSCNITA